jgi:hypothetical protein
MMKTTIKPSQTRCSIYIICTLLFCLMQQQARCAIHNPYGMQPQAFTYLGPTKWAPGVNTAATHEYTPPAGPAAPGGATWSIMPAYTLANHFDNHAGAMTVSLSNLLGGGEEIIFQQALDVWAGASGFTNFGKVSDTGLPFHNSAAFGIQAGDIRIGAIQFDNTVDQIAHAYAPGDATYYGGSINGDIHFNVDKNWVDDMFADGTAEQFDFFSVALHEIGHALGLGHSDVPGSVMSATYDGAKRTLQPDDIAGIQAIYTIPEPITLSLFMVGAWCTTKRHRHNQCFLLWSDTASHQ